MALPELALRVKANGTLSIKMLYCQVYVLCSILKFPVEILFLKKINSVRDILHVAKATYIVEMGIKTDGT